MKAILMTIVAMFVLIACCVLQIVGSVLQLAWLGIEALMRWVESLIDKLTDVYERLRSKADKTIPEVVS